MQNEVGVFYLAPLYDFKYGRGTTTESEIGGIWMPADQSEQAHVWFLPQYVQPLKAWADMSMPNKAIEASKGMVGWRPWVEVDFQLSRDTYTEVDTPSESENDLPTLPNE